MKKLSLAERIIASRRRLVADMPPAAHHKAATEGGCGVVGLAASFPVAGRHLIPPAMQMHNRGNGKGGGLAAAGLSPAQMRVSPEVLRAATLLQIAYLDPTARAEVEKTYLTPAFDILQGYRIPTLDDYREVPGLGMKPPEVWRYFVRVKPQVLARFAEENGLEGLPPRQVEDEFVYQNSFRLNQRFYASLGEKRAFVLCHGRDLLVFKIVGYAEQAAAYYRLEDLMAHVWIAHQRYPTKGRVWHPGGAHPFIGLNEALVHNGDFANYYAVCTYLRQRNIVPLFLTDTEVSVLLFDLWDRVYGYPLEVIVEALAPTTERDFTLLPPEKQRLYRAIQATHIHASPDGPWFFIIARSKPEERQWQLLGITDTSMLRPQVFALLESTNQQIGKSANRPSTHSPIQIGLIASEKQAIDATLRSLHQEDPRICPVADRYWNARGGSHTDGGTFIFTVTDRVANQQASKSANRQIGKSANRQIGKSLICTDKFGRVMTTPQDQHHNNPSTAVVSPSSDVAVLLERRLWIVAGPEGVEDAWRDLAAGIAGWDYGELVWYCHHLVELAAQGDRERLFALEMLTRLRDRAYDPGAKRRASILALVDEAVEQLLTAVPLLSDKADEANESSETGKRVRRLDWASRTHLRPPQAQEEILVVDVSAFPPEGEQGASRFLVAAYQQGWRHLITYGWRGQRFCGNGLGPGSTGVRIEVYGSSGDYLGSGLDGAEIHVHGTAQDQVGQILQTGKLVIHGDVGQTFMYGAKGGEAYVRGNAAGRPLINAVGRPRVVINGTCLDYLAESFMAGDPLNGGGFVILNGISFDDHGQMVELPTPYPGGNLFSLASGGAIYVRDPHRRLSEDQLNGGHFAPLTNADWSLIRPYLEENARLFDIPVEALLTVDGVLCAPEEVYRKIAATRLEVLT
ncbi:MAG: glutamate synthase [Anaerolineae bacterium]|nr:glutamate synthase [Anaerolineae bacterium]